MLYIYILAALTLWLTPFHGTDLDWSGANRQEKSRPMDSLGPHLDGQVFQLWGS